MIVGEHVSGVVNTVLGQSTGVLEDSLSYGTKQVTPTISIDPTSSMDQKSTDRGLKLFTEPPIPPSERIVRIEAGLFLIAGGMLVAMGGLILTGAALIELVGGELTGPFAPLVMGHGGAALAVGGILTVVGVGISGIGGYLVYTGVTGKQAFELELK